VLGLGSLLLWIALDSTVAKRAERIVEGARAMAVGRTPGPPIEGEDELAQIDHALRDAHAVINKQAHDLEERTRERSLLEQEIIQISEREQRRIGQDLHDDVCQRLAAVKMKVQDHEEKLASAAPALIDDAEAIANDLAGAIQITRSLARGLSPVEIDSGGIAIALSGLAKSSCDVFGIDCRFQADDAIPPLSHQTATQLYRIAQECIANAAKHARAQRVTVSLSRKPYCLILRVSNDGQPMLHAEAAGNGMGLSIMHYRAESIGATLDFESAPADATTALRCTLPLSPPDQPRIPSP
jgi:signal transduction histidine kinase